MFTCCSTVQQQKKLTDLIKPCPIHSKPILFVCKNVRTCIEKSLFCTDCADNHKGHQWETINNFFTPEISQLLTRFPLRPQETIEDIFSQIHSDVNILKVSIEKKLQQIEKDLKECQNQLKKKYPNLAKKSNSREKTEIDSLRNLDIIDNEKMSAILKIYEQEKNSEWLEDLYPDFFRVFAPTQKLISQLLTRFADNINRKCWDSEEKRKQNSMEYLQKNLVTNYTLDPMYFKFVEKYCNEFVSIQEDSKSLLYSNDNYSTTTSPGAIFSMPFTKLQNKVTLCIKKLQKTAFFFDASTIYIGVCLPKLARQHNYANFPQHSLCSYMINSKGKAFEKNNEDSKQRDSGMPFGEKDQIQIQIDFFTFNLYFRKKGAIKDSVFSVGLNSDKKNIEKLRGFVCFEGERGAKITVLPSQPSEKIKAKRMI